MAKKPNGNLSVYIQSQNSCWPEYSFAAQENTVFAVDIRQPLRVGAPAVKKISANQVLAFCRQAKSGFCQNCWGAEEAPWKAGPPLFSMARRTPLLGGLPGNTALAVKTARKDSPTPVVLINCLEFFFFVKPLVILNQKQLATVFGSSRLQRAV